MNWCTHTTAAAGSGSSGKASKLDEPITAGIGPLFAVGEFSENQFRSEQDVDLRVDYYNGKVGCARCGWWNDNGDDTVADQSDTPDSNDESGEDKRNESE